MTLLKRLTILILIFLAAIFLGAYVYHYVEGWRYLDSVYFTVITVTTIGYGDFSPQSDVGKIFTMFFSFFGIGMAFYFFSLIGRYMFSKHLRDKMKMNGRLKHNKGFRRVKP